MEYIENKAVEEEQVKGIVNDIIRYAPSKFVGFVGNALIVPVYTNILLPEQYGLYSLSIALLSFLCILFSCKHYDNTYILIYEFLLLYFAN